MQIRFEGIGERHDAIGLEIDAEIPVFKKWWLYDIELF